MSLTLMELRSVTKMHTDSSHVNRARLCTVEPAAIQFAVQPTHSFSHFPLSHHILSHIILVNFLTEFSINFINNWLWSCMSVAKSNSMRTPKCFIGCKNVAPKTIATSIERVGIWKRVEIKMDTQSIEIIQLSGPP